MHCLKCGTEIKAPEVFCANCRSVMDRLPVDKDAPVILPVRPTAAEPRPYRRPRQQPKAEEVVVQQRQKIRRLRITAAALLGCSLLLAVLLILFGRFPRMPEYGIGQNYHTVSPETTAPTAPPVTG